MAQGLLSLLGRKGSLGFTVFRIKSGSLQARKTPRPPWLHC